RRRRPALPLRHGGAGLARGATGQRRLRAALRRPPRPARLAGRRRIRARALLRHLRPALAARAAAAAALAEPPLRTPARDRLRPRLRQPAAPPAPDPGRVRPGLGPPLPLRRPRPPPSARIMPAASLAARPWHPAVARHAAFPAPAAARPLPGGR